MTGTSVMKALGLKARDNLIYGVRQLFYSVFGNCQFYTIVFGTRKTIGVWCYRHVFLDTLCLTLDLFKTKEVEYLQTRFYITTLRYNKFFYRSLFFNLSFDLFDLLLTVSIVTSSSCSKSFLFNQNQSSNIWRKV